MNRRCFKNLMCPMILIAVVAVGTCTNWCTAGEDIYKSFQQRNYSGSQSREYIVRLPTGYDQGTDKLPLVMVLHGCKQDHEAIKKISNFDAIADQETFIVVYPFITRHDPMRNQNCWGFWYDEHIHESRGEVQDLAEIVGEVMAGYRVDPERVHIAGLSSGGGMAVAALVAHCELFASGSPTAGVPYAETSSAVAFVCPLTGTFRSIGDIVDDMNQEMGDEKRPVPIFVIHSTGDCMVNIKAAEIIRDTWGMAFGVDTANPVSPPETGSTKGTPWTHKKYAPPDKRTVVETLFLEGLPHGWYGGRPGQYSYPNAPNTAQLIWDFFEQHPLHDEVRPTVRITNVQPDNEHRSIRVSGTVTDDHVDTLSVQVALLGLAPQAARDAQVDVAAKTFSFQSIEGLSGDTYYRPRAIVLDAAGASAEALGDAVALGNPTTQPPRVSIDHAQANLQRVSLRGTVVDDVGVISVDVSFDKENWTEADIDGGNWVFEGGGLTEGTHPFDVRAMDQEALMTIESGSVTVDLPYDAKQSSDFAGHLAGSRIRNYPNGFGSADKTVSELLQEHGPLESFWLYRAKSTDDWYADFTMIPLGIRNAFVESLGQAARQDGSTLNRPRVRRLLLELLEELEDQPLESSEAGCPACP